VAALATAKHTDTREMEQWVEVDKYYGGPCL
jgi:hypothetical protein